MNEILTVNVSKNKYPKITILGVGKSGCQTIEETLKSFNFKTTKVSIGTKDNNHTSAIFTKLQKEDIIFVTTFSNDEEGMKIALQLARYLKDIDTFSICVIPNSLAFESQSKSKKAKEILLELEKHYTAIIIPETKILSEPLKPQTISKTLSHVAIHAINSILESFFNKGKNDIKLGLADLRNIMKGKTTIESIKRHGR